MLAALPIDKVEPTPYQRDRSDTHVKKLAAAMERVEQDKFGTCEECGRDIREARLQAVPYTRYCVECAQNAENDGEPGFQPTLL